jgi:hypothetical protein
MKVSAKSRARPIVSVQSMPGCIDFSINKLVLKYATLGTFKHRMS